MTKVFKSADGKVEAVQCSYSWTDPDGVVETCHHHAACEICGQCSNIDTTGHEKGHCCGHLGLNEHIKVPGQDITRAQQELENARKRLPKRVGGKNRKARRQEQAQR